MTSLLNFQQFYTWSTFFSYALIHIESKITQNLDCITLKGWLLLKLLLSIKMNFKFIFFVYEFHFYRYLIVNTRSIDSGQVQKDEAEKWHSEALHKMQTVLPSDVATKELAPKPKGASVCDSSPGSCWIWNFLEPV